MSARLQKSLIGILFATHAALAIHTACVKSPVWDEIVYPAAGYDLLMTGKQRTNFDHPPLGKILYALPLLALHRRIAYDPTTARELDPFRLGFHFIYQNTISPRLLTLLPRLVAAGFSLALAWLIFWVSRNRWGGSGATLALFLFVLTPPILARASLALLEMPLAFFMMTAMACHLRWRENRRGLWLLGWGALWFCALWTKVSAIALLPVWLLSGIAESRSRAARKRRELTEVLLVALAVVLLCEAASRAVGFSYIGAQFLPRDSHFFLSRLPVYFHGRVWDHAKWYFSPAAWWMKTPISFMLLASAGAVHWYRRDSQDPLLADCIAVFLVLGLLMIGVRSIIATTHYFLLYPVGCLLAAGLGSRLRDSRRVRWMVYSLCACLVIGTVKVHPNHLAYFNASVGGSAQGYRWLGDSDQDWGQDLPTLAHWADENKISQLLLGYSGSGDPRAYGIPYQDFLSPALVSRIYRGEVFPNWPDKLLLVLSAKVWQSEPDALSWLRQHRAPVRVLGDTLLVYDFTHDPEAIRWLEWFYDRTDRPRQGSLMALLAEKLEHPTTRT